MSEWLSRSLRSDIINNPLRVPSPAHVPNQYCAGCPPPPTASPPLGYSPSIGAPPTVRPPSRRPFEHTHHLRPGQLLSPSTRVDLPASTARHRPPLHVQYFSVSHRWLPPSSSACSVPYFSVTDSCPPPPLHADAFYAQVECTVFPHLRGQPLVVVQYKCAGGQGGTKEARGEDGSAQQQL